MIAKHLRDDEIQSEIKGVFVSQQVTDIRYTRSYEISCEFRLTHFVQYEKYDTLALKKLKFKHLRKYEVSFIRPTIFCFKSFHYDDS